MDESGKFNAAIEEYYKLKLRYNNQLKNEIDKLQKNTSLSTRERRERFKLSKKCVVCNQPGGSLFRQDKNILSVECGHKEKHNHDKFLTLCFFDF